MIELFPGGFEERDGPDGVELAAYTDEGGEERLWHAFGGARSEPVAGGWEDRWRDFHRPVRVGPLWIGPPWHAPPRDAVAVVVDPGRAFGTGAHPTTRLCLRHLLGLPEPRSSLLDVGCGSGVLAIAAARLGFGPIVAVDVDPVAVEATRENAERNGVALAVQVADALADELPQADTAVANIALDPVRALAPRLRCRQLVASGYLVADELALPGYRRVAREQSGGWAADLLEHQ